MSSAAANVPQLLRHFEGPADTVTHLAFHPHQNRLASASADHTVYLWTFEPRLRCYRLTAHTGAVNAVAWSPATAGSSGGGGGGDVLASASSDRTVRLWVPTVRGSSGELRGHTAAVRHVDFNPSGRKVCTAADDRTVKCWSVVHKKYLCTYGGHTGTVRCAKFSPDGQLIASCSDDRSLRIVDVRAPSGGGGGVQQSSASVHSFAESKGSGTQLAWHPDDNAIAVALTHHRVKLYDLRTRKLLQLYEMNADVCTSLAFHGSGNYLAVGSRDATTKVLDLLEGRPIYTLMGHAVAVETCAFSPDGRRLATGGADRQIMVWSFTESNNDSENRSPSANSSSNTSATEAAAAAVDDETNDDENDVASPFSRPSIVVNPRSLTDPYVDDEFEVNDVY